MTHRDCDRQVVRRDKKECGIKQPIGERHQAVQEAESDGLVKADRGTRCGDGDKCCLEHAKSRERERDDERHHARRNKDQQKRGGQTHAHAAGKQAVL